MPPFVEVVTGFDEQDEHVLSASEIRRGSYTRSFGDSTLELTVGGRGKLTISSLSLDEGVSLSVWGKNPQTIHAGEEAKVVGQSVIAEKDKPGITLFTGVRRLFVVNSDKPPERGHNYPIWRFRP